MPPPAPPPPLPAPPVRVWRAACPQCGAPVDFRSPASAFAVCSFCRSQVLREGDALRRTGEVADLVDDHSALRLGASGTWRGVRFTLVGRRQLRSAEGVWSEWHALFDAPDGDGAGRSGWLSEDNGAYVFSFDVPLRQAAPAATDLRAGDGVTLDGLLWSVASVVVARVVAAEGELPAAPRLAGGFVVADLRNTAGEVGTLEYERRDAPPSWSVGRAVAIADLALTGLADGPSEASRRGRSLACPSCGNALTLTLDSTKTVVCGQCTAVVDVSGAAGTPDGAVRAEGADADVAQGLAHYAQSTGQVEPLIPLGSVGRLAVPDSRRSRAAVTPEPWQVVGYMERCTDPDPGSDEEQTFWREYLLAHRTEGFAFLVDSEDGWSLVRPLTGVPRPEGRSMRLDGVLYREAWRYASRVTHVLGEFYWVVKAGQRTRHTDYVGTGAWPQRRLNREQSGSGRDAEVTWSAGEAIDAETVRRAFGLAENRRAALARDVTPTTGRSATSVPVIGMIVGLIVLVLLLSRCDDGADRCADERQAFGEDSPEYRACVQRGGVTSRSSGGSWGGGWSGGHK